MLLLKLAEECNEIGQRVSKAIRFGLDEIQPGQSLTNRDRLVDELTDFIAATEYLIDEGIIPKDVPNLDDILDQRRKRIDKYLDYSRSLGILKTGVCQCKPAIG